MAKRLDWEKAAGLEKGRGGIRGQPFWPSADPHETFDPSFTKTKGVATTPFDTATIASLNAEAAIEAKKRAKKARKRAEKQARRKSDQSG